MERKEGEMAPLEHLFTVFFLDDFYLCSCRASFHDIQLVSACPRFSFSVEMGEWEGASRPTPEA